MGLSTKQMIAVAVIAAVVVWSATRGPLKPYIG